eukprot:Rhum_TRINITY_DN14939_c0_g1::Rhum_TRINITY_DN14939_c0_g1_i3::g.128706::m.128706
MEAEVGDKGAAIEKLHTDLAAKTAESESLTAELAATKEKLEEEIAAKKASLEAKEQQLVEKTAEATEKEATLVQKSEALTTELAATKEKLEGEIAAKQAVVEEKEGLVASVTVLKEAGEQEAVRLRSEIEEQSVVSRDEAEKLRQELSALRVSLDDATARSEAAEKRGEEVSQGRAELEATNTQLTKDAGTKSAEIARLQEIIEAAKVAVHGRDEKLKRAADIVREKDAAAKAKDAEHTAVVEDMLAKCSEAQQKTKGMDELQRKYEAIRTQWVAVSKTSGEMEQQFKLAQQNLRERDAELETLRQAKANEQGRSEDLSLLANMRAGEAKLALKRMQGMDARVLEILGNAYGKIDELEAELSTNKEELLSLPKLLEIQFDDRVRQLKQQIEELMAENRLLRKERADERASAAAGSIARRNTPGDAAASRGPAASASPPGSRAAPSFWENFHESQPTAPSFVPPLNVNATARASGPQTARPAAEHARMMGRQERVPGSTDVWTCSRCSTYDNPSTFQVCRICEARRGT